MGPALIAELTLGILVRLQFPVFASHASFYSETMTRTWACRIPPSPIEKLIPYQSVLALTDRTWAFQNRMPLIPKGEDP